jgi:uncharacterized SAM-binding protein YcdF (DUF218 family)
MSIMDVLAGFVKSYLLPGSLSFLVLGATVCVVLLLLGREARRRGRDILLGLLAMYWILALPVVGLGLESLLQGEYRPVSDPAALEGIEAIVVLSGGSATYRASGVGVDTLSEASALRAIEAARLYRAAAPEFVILSGGAPQAPEGAVSDAQAMRPVLLELGVPEDRILMDNVSGDTHAQAVTLAGMLATYQIESFVLVTSPAHMRRSMLAFEAQGLHPLASVAAGQSEGGQADARAWLPSERGLGISRAGVREALALVYYAARGWLTSTDT